MLCFINEPSELRVFTAVERRARPREGEREQRKSLPFKGPDFSSVVLYCMMIFHLFQLI